MLSFLAPSPNRAIAIRVVLMIAVLFGVYGLQQLGPWWYLFAVRPGQPDTWLFGWGSFLLHGNVGHLSNNAFALMMILVVWPRLFTGRVLLQAAVVIQAVSMLALYFLSVPNVLVIGASHLMYGFWVMMGVRTVTGLLRQGRTQAAWSIGAVLASFYALLLFEAYQEATAAVHGTTSWEGHMSGMLAGVLCAWLWRNAAYPLLPAPQVKPAPQALAVE